MLAMFKDMGWTVALAPNAPTSLAASPYSGTQLDLTWQDNSTYESNYKIERRPDGSANWTTIATLSSNSVSYSDTGLAATTKYYYRVLATYNGVDSGYSNIANATTLDVVPNAPSVMAASTISSTRVDLTWQDNSNNETGFRVERSSNGNTSWTTIATLSSNTTSYSDTKGLFPGVTYYYRVRSYNAAGNSAYSNEVTAITPGTAVDVGDESALRTNLQSSLPAGGLTIHLTSNITLTITEPLIIPSGVFINGGNCGSGAKTIATGGQNVIMSGGALLQNLDIMGGTLKITGGGANNPVTAICTVVKRA
jgi:fibronectin type 3 domain-containing protein